jgi:Zn-finger nucleic acid-binding protein
MTEPLAAIACRFCGATMARLACGALVLDRCNHCGGLWFDGGELESVLEWPEMLPARTPKGSVARSSDALIVCPRCTGVALEAVHRGAVRVHRCPRCHGVLVSRAAIEGILTATNDAGGSIDFDFPSGGGSGSGADGPGEDVIGAVLDFLGELLQPLG